MPGSFPFGAHGDNVNQQFSILGVVGTQGTTDVGGTAKTLPIGVDPATGAAYVYNLGPAGSVSLGNITGGTINLINNGTFIAQGIDSGGTKHLLSTDTGGVLNVNAAVSISGGTTNVGTVNTGTINTGTINVGTIGGKAASGAAAVANPVLIAGTDAGGTVYAPLVNSAGAISVTGASAGTFVNISSGTQQTLGTVGVLNAGTINAATAVLNSGTINVATAVITAGTIGGKAASGAAAVQNPVLIGGTDSGGTVYAPLITSGGALTVTGASAGTFVNISSGTLTTGSIIVTAGTVSAGTINTGTINTGTVSVAVGTINHGTIDGGSIVVTLGTVAQSGAWNVTGTIANGSIAVTAGTMIQTIGTVNTGTINTGTINVGTFVMPSGTLNVGTVTARINPLPIVNTISHVGTAGTLGIGTLIAAQGAGTTSYITGFHILAISGTPEVILAFGSQVNGPQVIMHGLFPAGGGIAKAIPFPHGYGTTNSAVTYQILSGAGTVAWDVDYFNSV